ncbi:MAG TPA: hypothetical protein VE085_08110 [Burkholderiales bacterium]|nr:hypothetical protein [Burkholderiales bacterium]
MPRLALMAALLVSSTVVHAADAALRADLQRLSHERIYFGHQSVGANILQGVKELSRAAGVPVFIKEEFVPENGDPLRKLESLKKSLGSGSRYDVALVKFCYVDIDADTDAAALFDRYRIALNELRARNPRTVFVHATLPLTTVQTGPRAWAKRLLDRAPYGTVENARRDQYNRLLRATYAGGEPIFDIARIESTAPDGKLVTVFWEGVTAPAMAPDYTDDGGHLNALGRARAAREFIAVLARASQKIEELAAATR